MCGVLARLSWHAPLQPDSGFSQALEELATRGPDGQGLWFDHQGKVCLGHTRLAIRGRADGAQPLSSPDGALHCVVNGEFYQTQALRQRLQAEGYQFRSLSDSELALALYSTRGLEFVQELEGEFALILWDQRHEHLIAARDRFGIKPLVYSLNSQGLSLASKARALFALGQRAAWDLQALKQALYWQYLLPEQTLFAGIKQLPPGHLLIANTQGQCSIQSYWELGYAASEQLSPQPASAQDFYQALRQAVQERLQAEVPVCSHLSGGLDSSSVLALMQQIQGRPADAFTVSFPESPEYDEAPLAQNCADYLGARLHRVNVSIEDLSSHFGPCVRLGEGLSINGHTVAKYLLNKEIRAQGFRVALTGEGADELLLGYAHFRQDLGLSPNNPRVAGLHTALETGLPASLKPFQEALGSVPSWIQAKAAQGQRLTSLLLTGSSSQTGFESLLDSEALQGRHPVHQAAWLWTRLALGNYILPTVGDGAEMAHGIEGRLPFLDYRLFESLQALAPEAYFQQGLEKGLLRQAMVGFLPPELLQRPKHPFLAPPLTGFAGWRTFLKASFRDLPALPLIDLDAVTRLLQALPDLPLAQHRLWDPVLNLLLSATWLQAGCQLEAA